MPFLVPSPPLRVNLRPMAATQLPIVKRLMNTPGRIRTCDQRIRNPLLYPLSYRGKTRFCRKLLPFLVVTLKLLSGPLTPALTPDRSWRRENQMVKPTKKSIPADKPARSPTQTSRSFHTPQDAGQKRSAANSTTSASGTTGRTRCRSTRSRRGISTLAASPRRNRWCDGQGLGEPLPHREATPG